MSKRWERFLRWLNDEPATAREASLFDAEDRDWRAASATSRDQSPAQRLEALANGDDAWRHNPFAFRVVEQTAELVLGRGMTLRSDDPPTQAFLDQFWHHPKNRMPHRQYTLFRELYLTGELFVALFTNPYDRMTYLRPIPSSQFDQVETDPDDLETEIRYHQLATATTPDRWWTADEMAHFALYQLVGTTRGLAHIAPSLPWLRRYRDWLTDRFRINHYKGAYLWDVTIKGADRHAIIQRQSELSTPPKPGEIVIHSDGEEWKAVTSNVDAPEAALDGKALRRMVALGAGFPMHYLAEADDTNLATAHEQERPVTLHVQRLQADFGYFVADLARRAALRSDRFPRGPGPIQPIFPESDTTDALQIAQAAKAGADALAIATDRGWVDQAHAGALFNRLFSTLATEPTPSHQARR